MELDPGRLTAAELNSLLTSTVCPRPIAWISTVDREGHPNLAPFSFFNVVSLSPPMLSVSFIRKSAAADGKKDTLRNIEATGVFTVNIVPGRLAAEMNLTSGDFGPGVDEAEAAGLSLVPGSKFSVPRLSGVPASYECETHSITVLGEGRGSGTLVLGRIAGIHLDDTLADGVPVRGVPEIDPARFTPIGRLGGNRYVRVQEVFEMSRPAPGQPDRDEK